MKKILSGVSLLLASAVASASPVAAIVVTDATTSLENQIPSMTAVLTTVLGLTALVMAFSWIRRVMK